MDSWGERGCFAHSNDSCQNLLYISIYSLKYILLLLLVPLRLHWMMRSQASPETPSFSREFLTLPRPQDPGTSFSPMDEGFPEDLLGSWAILITVLDTLIAIDMISGYHGRDGHRGVIINILSTPCLSTWFRTLEMRQKGGMHKGNLLTTLAGRHPLRNTFDCPSNSCTVSAGGMSVRQISLLSDSLLSGTAGGTPQGPISTLMSPWCSSIRGRLSYWDESRSIPRWGLYCVPSGAPISFSSLVSSEGIWYPPSWPSKKGLLCCLSLDEWTWVLSPWWKWGLLAPLLKVYLPIFDPACREFGVVIAVVTTPVDIYWGPSIQIWYLVNYPQGNNSGVCGHLRVGGSLGSKKLNYPVKPRVFHGLSTYPLSISQRKGLMFLISWTFFLTCSAGLGRIKCTFFMNNLISDLVLV